MGDERTTNEQGRGAGESAAGTVMAPASRTRRVLVVDDDEAVLQVAAEALESAGYHCVKARSAEQALMFLQSSGSGFDLLLSDVTMEGMTGIELMRRAGKLIPGLAAVIMSGATEVETPVEALRAGACDYLIKPFDVEEILACVSGVMEKKESAAARDSARADGLIREAAARAFALSLDARDKETEGHTERVVAFSRRLGAELGLGQEEMIALELGAHLHDIGKIAVPDQVLKKPQALNEEEWAKMRVHPAKGQEMVRNMNLPEGAALVVGQHHERWDGGGYPAGLAGEGIYIGARVFMVIDTFDAITSDRCYRRGRPYQVALEEITRHSGSQFDPAVVEAFARVDPAEWDEIRSRCPADPCVGDRMIAC